MKKISLMFILMCISINLVACSQLEELMKPVDNTVYDVNPDEYVGMRDGGEYHEPAEGEESGRYVDERLIEADNKTREEVESQKAVEESRRAAEESSKAAIESSIAAEASKAAEAASKAASEAGGSGSAGGTTTLSGKDSDLAGAGNTRSKDIGEVRTIIRENDTSNYSSNISSGGNTNKDVSKKNVASIKKSGTLYDCYITIENAFRGSQAIRRLNTYNSRHVVEYNMNIPDGYELFIVTFTVEPSSNLGSNSDGVYIPKTRIRKGSGSSFGDHSIFGHVLQLSQSDYDDDDDSTHKNSTFTYDLVFELPDDVDTYSVIFGETSGTTYRFKSTSLD